MHSLRASLIGPDPNIAGLEQTIWHDEQAIPRDGARQEGGLAIANPKPAQDAKFTVSQFKNVACLDHNRLRRGLQAGARRLSVTAKPRLTAGDLRKLAWSE